MKKNIKIISALLILVAILLILVGLVFNNKKKNDFSDDANKSNDDSITKLGVVVCSKNEDSTMYVYTEENTINGDKNGNFTNATSKQIYKYKDENIYQQLKNAGIDISDDTQISYNDEEKAVIYTSIINDVYNSKNEKVNITVKEYKEALESNDYTCLEK